MVYVSIYFLENLKIMMHLTWLLTVKYVRR